MQVRTKYLPEVDAPLVLRFDHEGREVVVEGSVAWRSETEGGGDFGIRFTALDSNSVSVLRQLSALERPAPLEPPVQAAVPSAAESGAAVKLHIDGLAAPMKARVFQSTSRKVHVGSQLEFLKVGRSLELEDVSGGQKRGAHIESVSVTLDPQTQIPQLVVHLRYEGEEVTPQPSVVDQTRRTSSGSERASAESPAGLSFSRSTTRSARSASSDAPLFEDDFSEVEAGDEDEAIQAAEDLFKSRVAQAISAGQAALSQMSGRARELAHGVGAGVGTLLAAVNQRVSDSGKSSGKKPSLRAARRTSSAPMSVSSGDPRPREARRLRPQHPGQARASSAAYLRSPKFLGAAGGAACVFIAGAYLLFSDGEPPVASAPLPPLVQPAALQQTPQPVAPQAVGVAAAPGDLPGGLDGLDVLPPGQFPPAATLGGKPGTAASGNLVAEVPLFGETEMAMAEAAPLQPTRSAGIDELSLSKDQAFADSAEPVAAPAAEQESIGQTEWQVGRMHLPVVHRLRLDAAGTALQPTKSANGFSILVPGRQLKETASHIAGRDERITDVRVSNTPGGAKVTFRFRGEVPGYKVRLRNDFLEVFINSPASAR
jgi:hypothetical protein